MKLKTLLYIILGLLLTTTLINISVFEDLSYSAFYFYCIFGSAVVLASGIIMIKSKTSVIIPNPIIFFLLLVVYYFFQGLLITGTGIGEQHYYLLISFLLFISIFIWAGNGLISIKGVSSVVTLLLLLESLYCFLQLFEILPSSTPFFRVTGSWVNPNVTALFMAMGFPALLHLFLNEEKSPNKALYFTIMACVILALFLLNCRTAFIAVAVSSFIQLNGKYKIGQKIKTSPLKPFTIIFLAVSITAVTSIAYFMYQGKAASANGRLFIWKISVNTALEKPFTGHGYGFFARNYNLKQAEYFAKGKATTEEIGNSSYVLLAYNEILQQLVDGGLIAALLTILFLASVLKEAIKRKPSSSHTLVAGIVSFLIISCFNFAIQAIPIFCLFFIYAAFACQNDTEVSHNSNARVKAPFVFVLDRAKAFVFSAIAILIFFVMSFRANASMQNKKASQLLREGKINEAIEAFESITEKHKSYVDCELKLANAYFMQRRFKDALSVFEKTQAYSSQPDIFLKKGFCLLQFNDVSGAIENCRTAMNIAPNRLEAKYALMNINIFKKDTAGALVYAREIAVQVPKKKSEQADFYKKQAMAFINITTNEQ